jgi:hypothetical protein
MKLSVITLALLATTPVFAATTTGNIIKADNGSLLLQGTNASGVSAQSVAISNVGHISARSADFNGADGISTQKVTFSNGGTISGTSQVITIDAVGNGNIIMRDSLSVQGNITGTQTISTSGTIQTTGTGSIVSAYGLNAASNKFNVAGDSGLVTTNGINNSNKTISNLADGVNATDAVNVRQLNAEATARINGDVNTLNLANNYTNTQVNNAVGQANNYTDNRVNAETQRAMQAERGLENHINAVGAMAMAVGSLPRTMYNPDRKSRLNLGIGNYGNATAMAVGLSHDFNDRISGNLNVAQSITGNGNSGVGAGLSIGF